MSKLRKLFKGSTFLALIIACTFVACSPENNSVVSNAFHNTTSHYNAYFIANEDIKEIKTLIGDKYQWNYNLILPVFPQFDTIVAQSYKTQIEHCITKASLAIQWHKGSKWEDDSYILVGLARFYDCDYVNAIETFKYVNTKSKNDNARHEALVALMRAFIEYNELNNAQAVSDYLKKEKLNKENLKNLYLNRGYLYQKRKDLDFMVQNLILAEPLISDSNQKARINFIIGQVYQSLNLDGEAHRYYKNTLKNNPPYELSFYTKLNMAQVTQLAQENDAKKVRKYFKKLLKDRKNAEFKDKIYYEMAWFETRHNNQKLGIQHFNSSIRASVKNKRQKAHSYWSLGRIYYDSLANYKMAKLYYDSTMMELPKDEIEYESIQERQKILDNFVTQLTVVEKNDSLLHLSEMSADALDLLLDEYIAKEEAAENARRKKAKEREKNIQNNQINTNFGTDQLDLGASNMDGQTWYFYSPTAVNKGRSIFKSVWGNRILEDNWRRKSKPAEGGKENSVEQDSTTSEKPTKNSKEGDEFKINKKDLIATIPSTEEQKKVLLDEIEQASYKLGNIYNFDLVEKNNAIQTFEKLIQRFPKSEYRYEVMYLLYLIYGELNNVSKQTYHKNNLISEAPESIYAKLVINPNYREESQAASEKLKKMYAKAYYLYKASQLKEAMSIINNGLAEYTDNDFVDNMSLLKILVNSKTQSVYKYEYELKEFLTVFPESELNPYVKSLITASENFQINLVNSTKAKFSTDLSQSHYFVFVYQTNPELSDALLAHFTSLQSGFDNLEIGTLLLDKEFSMILISEFKNKESALQYDQLVKSENLVEKINKSGKFYNFVITKENFNTLYQTKELDSYLTFFGKYYQ